MFKFKITSFIQGVTKKYLVLDVIISLKVFTILSIFNKSTNLISVHGVPHKIALCFLTQAGSMLIFSLGGQREKDRLRDEGV